jgi:hypothetical protein
MHRDKRISAYRICQLYGIHTTHSFIRSSLFELQFACICSLYITPDPLLLVGSLVTSSGFAILHELMIQHKLGMGTYLLVNIRFLKSNVIACRN